MLVSTEYHFFVVTTDELEAHTTDCRARQKNNLLSIRLASPHHRCNMARNVYTIWLDATQ